MPRLPTLGVGELIICASVVGYSITKLLGGYIAVVTLILTLTYNFYQFYKPIELWKRLGVATPPGWPFFGNFLDIMKKGIHNCELQWTKEYGSIFGIYLFVLPDLIISDKELLKRILVRDFHKFNNRRKIDQLWNKKSIFRRLVSVLRDEEWKNTRSAITPAFTSGKLKNTVHLMDTCIKTCCDILEEKQNDTDGVDVKSIVTNLTVDIIAAAAFALDTDAQRNPDNNFLKFSKQISNINIKSLGILLTMMFPWTLSKLDEYFGISVLFPGMENFYVSYLTSALKERRQHPKVDQLDFLQLMINAADPQTDQSLENDHEQVSPQSKSVQWKVSDRDIIAQSFLFLLAGQENTSNTVHFVLYLLAVHKEVQEKAFQEIQALTPNGEAITYAHMQHQTPYLESIMLETQRLYPTIVRFERECQNDYQLTDQLIIPKGTIVCVPVYAIHHNSDNYENPEEFDPERFLIDDKRSTDPLSYLPFGYGPRNCIGMRFAMLEMKLIVSNLIRKFHIETCAATPPWPLEMEMGTSVLKPKTPIRLQFKRRLHL